MAISDELEGHSIRFQLVGTENAEYIQALRPSPEHGRHLSVSAPSVDAQRAWNEGYKARKAESREAYVVIERRVDGARCCVIRLFDLARSNSTRGSWISDLNKPAKASLDSALPIYRIAGGFLACVRGFFGVRAKNAHRLAFCHRFSVVEAGSDALNQCFKLEADAFARLAPSLDAVFLSPERV